MDNQAFMEDLHRFGPQSNVAAISDHEASEYCRRLALSHYENFSVVSWLLPRKLRRHFCNVYAYCRWADDLADEVSSADERLALLAWWRQSLHDCFVGRAQHPVFIALHETIEEFSIPETPFLSLLDAFEQDQRQVLYETHDELLGYCQRSANPVGHLVLYLGRCHSETNAMLSDSVCTGLQLANFLQDVAGDFDRGRIYIPQESCRAFDYTEDCFVQHVVDARWRGLMQIEVDRASRYLHRGWPLVDDLPKELRFQVELFVRGGLAILQEIRRVDYDVWTMRPTVGRLTQIKLAASSWLRSSYRRAKRDHG
jgi:squalene synthase HpnC